MRQRAKALSPGMISTFVESKGGLLLVGDKGINDSTGNLGQSKNICRHTQPVGLVDLDMETAGTAQYTAAASAIITKEAGAARSGTQGLRVTCAGGGVVGTFYATRTTNPFIVGCRYKGVKVWGRTSSGTGAPRIYCGAAIVTGVVSASWQLLEVPEFTADATYLALGGSVADGAIDFDDLSLGVNLSISAIGKLPAGGNLKIADIPLVNGTFEAATISPWTADRSTCTLVTASPYSGSKNLRVAYNATAVGYAVQAGILTVGNRVIFRCWYRTSGITMRVYLGSGTTTQDFPASATTSTWTYAEFTGAVNGTTDLYIGSGALAAAQWVEFDKVSVEPVYFYQTTAASMPNLTTGYNGRNILVGSNDALDSTLAASKFQFLHNGIGATTVMHVNFTNMVQTYLISTGISGSFNKFRLFIQATGTLYLQIYGTGAAVIDAFAPAGTIVANTNYVIVVKSIYGQNTKVYLNGVVVIDTAWLGTPSTLDTNYTLQLFYGQGAGVVNLQGNCGLVAVIPTAISDKEVNLIGRATAQMFNADWIA